jgi:hypothetical protein
MYIYTDIAVPSGTYAHNTRFYYKDPQTGATIGEAGLRLAKKDGTNPWVLHSSPGSVTDAVWNKNNTNNLTTFGYFTLTDVPNNASAAELVGPVGFFCSPATHPVKVKIKNNGNNNINSVWVGFTINGVPGTPVQHNNTIYTLGSPQGNEATVTITNYNFTTSNPISFVVYTYSPNGQTDPAPGDDTIKFVLRPGLNGIYTVGGATPDYPTVDSAVKDVNKYGVCGPVTFNIRAGNYAAPPSLNTVQGGSATNRVTFQAENGIASSVTITAAATGAANNFAFAFNNATNATLRNLTLVNTNTSFGTVVSLAGNNTGDSILGCTLTSSVGSYTSTNNAVVFGNGNTMTDFGITGNTLTGGSYSFYLLSGGTKAAFDNNTVTNPYYSAFYVQNIGAIKIRGNSLNVSSTNAAYTFYVANSNSSGTNGPEISENNISTNGYAYTFYVTNFNGTSTARAKLNNNTISGSPLNYNYGMYIYTANYADVYNNTLTTNNSTYAYGLMMYYSNYCNVYNNKLAISSASSYLYGGYMYDNRYSKFYNNEINCSASTSGTTYGMMWYYGYNDTLVNNTINVATAGTTGYAMYALLGSTYNNHMFLNNAFTNMAGGYALYLSDDFNNNNIFDYNNLYTSSTTQYSATPAAANMAALRAATNGKFRNSLNYNPGYVSNTDLHPDPNNPSSWSLNGRGVHLLWNSLDKEGSPRVTTLAAGVPDIGAYEFVPNTTPPLAVATPAVPAVGKQVFTFGQDTVAVLTWKPNTQIPNTISVRQYTGTQPPSFPNTGKMYFYVDVNGANSTYDYTGDVYYKDPWRGTTSATETNLRMVKKLTPGAWQAYNGTLSSVNAGLNILKANMTDLGMMTGIDDGILFSAIVTPGGNLIFCPGGSVTLHANSGAGYTYQWTYNTVNIPGATAPSYVATAAGDYAVKITDPNNITATSNPILVTIIAPPAAQVSASGPLTYCTGGTLTLNAATAPNQTYQWYLNGNLIPGATQANHNVSTHGNYTVMVKNAGCASTSPIQVVSEGPLNVSLGSDTSFCEGTPLTLDAGYPGASYLWSDGSNGQTIQITNKSQSGTYWVSVNAGPNCQDVDTIHVNVNPLPSVIGISYVKNNNTYYFEPSGPSDVISYLWMFDDGTTDTAKKPVKVYNSPEFKVKLVVFNACGTDTSVLDLPLAVSNLNATDVQVSVYPNPASSRITLATEGTKFSGLSVINDLGQTVYRSTLEGDRSKEDVDVSSLANGHYFIRATAANGSIINKPFNIVR